MTEQNTPQDEDSLDVLFSKIKQARDELKLKLHLGEADVKSEWEKLEGKWREVEKRAQPVTDALQDSAEAAGEQAKKLAEVTSEVAVKELKAGYEKMKKMLG